METSAVTGNGSRDLGREELLFPFFYLFRECYDVMPIRYLFSLKFLLNSTRKKKPRRQSRSFLLFAFVALSYINFILDEWWLHLPSPCFDQMRSLLGNRFFGVLNNRLNFFCQCFSQFVLGESGSQIPVRPWRFLYERVDKSNTLSCFVVGRTRSECGLPMAVYKKE